MNRWLGTPALAGSNPELPTRCRLKAAFRSPGSWPRCAIPQSWTLPMNRSAELQLCANQQRAKLELRAPIVRFMALMRVQGWRSKLPMMGCDAGKLPRNLLLHLQPKVDPSWSRMPPNWIIPANAGSRIRNASGRIPARRPAGPRGTGAPRSNGLRPNPTGSVPTRFASRPKAPCYQPNRTLSSSPARKAPMRPV